MCDGIGLFNGVENGDYARQRAVFFQDQGLEVHGCFDDKSTIFPPFEVFYFSLLTGFVEEFDPVNDL
jgi:hypothetical protein